MLDFAFFYYLVITTLSSLLNSFIIIASVSKSIRGEFKWIFFASSITNILLSLTQCILMPTVVKWPSSNEFNLILTSNPLVALFSDNTEESRAKKSSFCSILYHVFYFRQIEASVLSICLVPLNRAFAVCWKHAAPSNAKTWIPISMIPNIVPFIVYFLTRPLTSTNLKDLNAFSEEALIRLYEKTEPTQFCSLVSNYRKLGDVAETVFLILCPILSYPIAIYCVIKLFIFLRTRKGNVRNNVSSQVIQRQKGILMTIIIQAIAPLIIYLPLFLSVLIVDNSWGIQQHSEMDWYGMSAIHFTISWSPCIDALATIIFIKPYRRAFIDYFSPTTTVVAGMIHVEHPQNRRVSDVALSSCHKSVIPPNSKLNASVIFDGPDAMEPSDSQLKETTL
ncbi:unnamed protein product [Auanema sp. JU1783]|nr:unnamed protein product [Auanema sp. JU1783]